MRVGQAPHVEGQRGLGHTTDSAVASQAIIQEDGDVCSVLAKGEYTLHVATPKYAWLVRQLHCWGCVQAPVKVTENAMTRANEERDSMECVIDLIERHDPLQRAGDRLI